MDPYVFIDSRPAVDVLIRQESIDGGLSELGKRLGVTLPPYKTRENRSCRPKDSRGYDTDQLADSVGGSFAEANLFVGIQFQLLRPGSVMLKLIEFLICRVSHTRICIR